MDKVTNQFKAGYAAIIGLPNSGKSTLMNAILDIKLSITSAKPQTTRKRVLGILNSEAHQVIFIDTPGILKPRYGLQEKMMQQVHSALGDADILIQIVDASLKSHPVNLELKKINVPERPVLLILNKIDIMSKKDILTLIDLYQAHYPFSAIIPISALKNDGLENVKKELFKILPLSPPYYPPDSLTDHPERFFVAEIIREKIFEKFSQEIPYSTEVVIEDFKERDKGKDYIYAVILVERKSQKGILIGKGGEALRKIGALARTEIETLLQRKVYLDLRVKVNENWRRDELQLKRLGY